MGEITFDLKKCLVVSIHMENIDPKTVEYHRLVMNRFNKNSIPSMYAKTKLDHAQTMDAIWSTPELNHFESIMFLDIDAIPVRDMAILNYFQIANEGLLVGNVQRSNHIDNNQHMFAAPSAVCMTRATYEKIGKPSAVPTSRGDVGEEYTYAAESAGVNIFLAMPISYDRPVNRFPWEKDQSATWKLADGYPDYGVGTTFAFKIGETVWSTIWHSFQSFHPGHQEMFWQKCEQLLGLTQAPK